MKFSWIAVRALVEAAEVTGIKRERLCQRAQIDPTSLTNYYGWAHSADFDRLMAAAVELSDSPRFGLHWGHTSPMLQFAHIPLLLANAPSLRESIALMLSLHGVLIDEPLLSLRVGGNKAQLRLLPEASLSDTTMRALDDLAMSGLKRFFDYYTSGGSQASYNFAYDPGEQRDAYTRIFGDACRFQQPVTSAEFPIGLLDASNAGRNSELYASLSREVDLLRVRLASKLSYSDRVKAAVREALPRQRSMGEVASSFAMSERSLRRRLADEGTSFSSLLEDCLIDLALELLKHPASSVKAVASELGFASMGGFHRAFKRRTGRSPAAHRREAPAAGAAPASREPLR